MSQKKIPQKRVHRGKGQDYVRDPRTGRQILLGPTGTVESQQAYTAWIASYVREVGISAEIASRPTGSFEGLLARYLEECSRIYLNAAGLLTQSYGNCLTVARNYLTGLVGREISSITRADIVAIQRGMIAKGLTAKATREYMGIVKRLIKFGEQEGLIDPHHALTLRSIPDLRPTEGARSKQVQPIPIKHAFAIYRELNERWRAIFAFHLFTGQRAETALRAKFEEIDTSTVPWKYSPVMHKNTWRGKPLTILIGPRARAAIRPYMSASGMLWPGRHMNISLDKQKSTKVPRCRDAYKRAIESACQRAGLPHYTPQQIRHTSATFLVGKLVPESIIGAILGHHGRGDDDSLSTGSGTITGRYAAVSRRRVEAVVEKWG
jgi:integrase